MNDRRTPGQQVARGCAFFVQAAVKQIIRRDPEAAAEAHQRGRGDVSGPYPLLDLAEVADADAHQRCPAHFGKPDPSVQEGDVVHEVLAKVGFHSEKLLSGYARRVFCLLYTFGSENVNEKLANGV